MPTPRPATIGPHRCRGLIANVGTDSTSSRASLERVGRITGETSTTLTLRRPDGREQTWSIVTSGGHARYMAPEEARRDQLEPFDMVSSGMRETYTGQHSRRSFVRVPHCTRYDDCLDHAARLGWAGMTCAGCAIEVAVAESEQQQAAQMRRAA